jgi:hypothetical protein
LEAKACAIKGQFESAGETERAGKERAGKKMAGKKGQEYAGYVTCWNGDHADIPGLYFSYKKPK